MNFQILFYTLCFIACFTQAEAQNVVLEINTNKKGAEIAPTMYGVFFEDINYGADGGLYGELIKNRSFEYPQPLMGWNTIGDVVVKDDGPFNRCPHYVRLSYSGKRDMATGIENRGFLGMSLLGGEQYRFTVWARVPEDGEAQLNIGLRDLDSQEENLHHVRPILTYVAVNGVNTPLYSQLRTRLKKRHSRCFLKEPFL